MPGACSCTITISESMHDCSATQRDVSVRGTLPHPVPRFRRPAASGLTNSRARGGSSRASSAARRAAVLPTPAALVSCCSSAGSRPPSVLPARVSFGIRLRQLFGSCQLSASLLLRPSARHQSAFPSALQSKSKRLSSASKTWPTFFLKLSDDRSRPARRKSTAPVFWNMMVSTLLTSVLTVTSALFFFSGAPSAAAAATSPSSGMSTRASF
mmetsp:Transcript_13463/g.34322  ORF Transcript_13463/g.34322 Transcript_13463/m.34322 type:complete len:212 (-) Transcript_13463:53-688(-)